MRGVTNSHVGRASFSKGGITVVQKTERVNSKLRRLSSQGGGNKVTAFEMGTGKSCPVSGMGLFLDPIWRWKSVHQQLSLIIARVGIHPVGEKKSGKGIPCLLSHV